MQGLLKAVKACQKRIFFNVSLGEPQSIGLALFRYCNTRPPTSQADNLMSIGSRKIFNDEHDIFRRSVRRFFEEEVLPHDKIWVEKGQVSREVWLEAGKRGLLGINISSESGGVGGSFIDSIIVSEEQAYINHSGAGFGLHSDIVLPYIDKYGTIEQKQRFIPDLVSGSKICAIAMTEPSGGSDLQGMKTNAKRRGTDFILNGSKVFITNGWMSDVFIVAAVTNPKAKSIAHGMTLFILEDGTAGFHKGRKLEKMGCHASDTAELFFDDVCLPSSSILGEIDKGFYYLMNELPRERLLIGVIAIAASEWMFETTKQYVKERKAFGNSISKFQVIGHMLAEMKTNICIGRHFIDDCIMLQADGKLDASMGSMCKYWGSDLQNKVAYECVQLHGGWGYMQEYPISKAYIDARAQPIYGGTNEIMKELIARDIFRK